MKELGRKAFALTARYDAAISNYLGAGQGGLEPFPVTFTAQWRKLQGLRYGENPHQAAVFYSDTTLPDEPTLGGAQQLQGKELSYNNIVDIDAALQLALEFADPRRGRRQAHEPLRRGGLEAPSPGRLQEGARVRPRLRLRRRASASTAR